MPLNKILQCEVQEGQIVNPKTVLFIVYLEEQVISVSVYIPWQPEVIDLSTFTLTLPDKLLLALPPTPLNNRPRIKKPKMVNNIIPTRYQNG
ncbi:20049_t:CDS:2, partial [Funneliformis geosporum]